MPWSCQVRFKLGCPWPLFQISSFNNVKGSNFCCISPLRSQSSSFGTIFSKIFSQNNIQPETISSLEEITNYIFSPFDIKPVFFESEGVSHSTGDLEIRLIIQFYPVEALETRQIQWPSEMQSPTKNLTFGICNAHRISDCRPPNQQTINLVYIIPR